MFFIFGSFSVSGGSGGEMMADFYDLFLKIVLSFPCFRPYLFPCAFHVLIYSAQTCPKACVYAGCFMRAVFATRAKLFHVSSSKKKGNDQKVIGVVFSEVVVFVVHSSVAVAE